MPLQSHTHLRQPDINSQHAVIAKAKHDREDIESRLQDAFLIKEDVHERQSRNENKLLLELVSEEERYRLAFADRYVVRIHGILKGGALRRSCQQ